MAKLIKALAHVCLNVSDLNEAEDFLCAKLGLKKKFDFVKGGETIGFYLEVSKGSYIEVFKGSPLPASEGVMRHVCLETSDIDSLIETLAKRGCKMGEKKLGVDKSWQVWVGGPDGLAVEFHQYTPESCQLTGRDCEVGW